MAGIVVADRSETARVLMELDDPAPAGVEDDSGQAAIVWMVTKMPPVVSSPFFCLVFRSLRCFNQKKNLVVQRKKLTSTSRFQPKEGERCLTFWSRVFNCEKSHRFWAGHLDRGSKLQTSSLLQPQTNSLTFGFNHICPSEVKNVLLSCQAKLALDQFHTQDRANRRQYFHLHRLEPRKPGMERS